jgi:hypothetical protein
MLSLKMRIIWESGMTTCRHFLFQEYVPRFPFISLWRWHDTSAPVAWINIATESVGGSFVLQDVSDAVVIALHTLATAFMCQVVAWRAIHKGTTVFPWIKHVPYCLQEKVMNSVQFKTIIHISRSCLITDANTLEGINSEFSFTMSKYGTFT